MQDSSQNIIIKQLPPSGERLPLLLVGDVHGCAREFADLIQKARNRMGQFQLLLVGDLFTKGPDPVGVFELIQEHGALCIKGNHDWALWASLIQAQKRGVASLPEHTRQTLHLIRYHRRAIFDFLSTLPHVYTTTIRPAVKRKDWEAEYSMIVVHAGIDVTQGLTGTSERMLLTARYVRWDESEAGRRRLVLVPTGHRADVLGTATQGGHRPVREGETMVTGLTETARHETVMTTHTVHSQIIDRFRWHELHQGPELVVFGHDAKQGLFRKTLSTGRPICVGIDTGCTYGRSLTGYFPELDDAIQAPARRTYFDLEKNVIILRTPNPPVAV